MVEVEDSLAFPFRALLLPEDPAPWPDSAPFQRATSLVGLSMSTISLLEVDREFVCPTQA